jgi:hypothetical protein
MSASYRETISWLFNLQKFGIKLGLSSITRLLELLGNPHHGLHCIHIVQRICMQYIVAQATVRVYILLRISLIFANALL